MFGLLRLSDINKSMLCKWYFQVKRIVRILIQLQNCRLLCQCEDLICFSCTFDLDHCSTDRIIVFEQTTTKFLKNLTLLIMRNSYNFNQLEEGPPDNEIKVARQSNVSPSSLCTLVETSFETVNCVLLILSPLNECILSNMGRSEPPDALLKSKSGGTNVATRP